jgi:hypothetical protein
MAAPVPRSLLLAAIVVTATLGLAGCGGGSDESIHLGVNAIVGGQPLTTVFVPGATGTVDILAGQSVELDANEPVIWAFSINGSPLFGNGTTVFFSGLTITETAVSQSRVVIDTSAVGPFAAPVIITLTATSTIDAAEVALIDLVVH